MDVRLLPQVLALRAALRRRDLWDPSRIAAHQQQALHRLREATYAGSEFYRRRHAGLHTAPLHELPPVTKADLMDNFDEAVTTPDLTLADLEGHLRTLTESAGDPGRPFRGRWWAAATAGTTGGAASLRGTARSGRLSWPPTRGPTTGREFPSAQENR